MAWSSTSSSIGNSPIWIRHHTPETDLQNFRSSHLIFVQLCMSIQFLWKQEYWMYQEARTERAELKEHDAHFIQTTSRTKEHRKTKRKKNAAWRTRDLPKWSFHLVPSSSPPRSCPWLPLQSASQNLNILVGKKVTWMMSACVWDRRAGRTIVKTRKHR